MRGLVRKLAVLLLAAVLGHSPLMARDWYVNVNSMVTNPDGSPNRPYLAISDALNDAFFFMGDTILVSPGTYNENVFVDGVAAHLVSTEGPLATIIDGGGLGSAVHFKNAGASSLTGFTITGGVAQFGGGVEIFAGSPTISHNIIIGNSVFEDGSDPAFGGGLDAYYATNLVVVDNLFVGNHADGSGGGLYLEKCFQAEVSFNTVVGNTVGTGGQSYGPGMFLLNGTGVGSVHSNIVASNISNVTPPIEAGGLELFSDNSVVQGNLLFQNTPQDLVIDEVVVVLPDGSGNVAADPRFVDAVAGNYRLLVDSPALDAVASGFTPPAVDLDGNPRPLDGDAAGGAVADLGCYENLGSLNNLLVSAGSVVSWDAAFTPPGAYHLYRGTLTGLSLGDAGACQDARDGNLLDTQFTEPDVPALGAAFTFLAGFELNGADSALGVAANGAARQPVLLCP